MPPICPHLQIVPPKAASMREQVLIATLKCRIKTGNGEALRTRKRCRPLVERSSGKKIFAGIYFMQHRTKTAKRSGMPRWATFGVSIQDIAQSWSRNGYETGFDGRARPRPIGLQTRATPAICGSSHNSVSEVPKRVQSHSWKASLRTCNSSSSPTATPNKGDAADTKKRHTFCCRKSCAAFRRS